MRNRRRDRESVLQKAYELTPQGNSKNPAQLKMALSTLLRGFWDDPWEGAVVPSRLFDQDFGNILPDDYFVPNVTQLMRPFSAMPKMMQQIGGKSEVVNTDQEFRVNLDVHHFKPEEINVKTKDNRIIISASHEERPDEHGFIKREFTRQYVLPKDVDPLTVTSNLNKDGVLTLKAPKKALEDKSERKIPITHERQRSGK